jgi:hypothetical protein
VLLDRSPAVVTKFDATVRPAANSWMSTRGTSATGIPSPAPGVKVARPRRDARPTGRGREDAAMTNVVVVDAIRTPRSRRMDDDVARA